MTASKVEIQLNSMNSDLRNTLWNFLHSIIGEPSLYSQKWGDMLRRLYIHYFKIPVNLVPSLERTCMNTLYELFNKLLWYEVYNLLEVFLCNLDVYSERYKNEDLERILNHFLERENSGYRLTSLKFLPITNQYEIDSLNETIGLTNNSELRNINSHFEKAVILLSKKPQADYHNSIKESITAVEGICKLITKVESGGIKDALRILSSKIEIPTALQEGLAKLYGYTSGKDGIRHPLLSKRTIGYAEAKFMLVTCSAFCNFIIDNSRNHNLL